MSHWTARLKRRLGELSARAEALEAAAKEPGAASSQRLSATAKALIAYVDELSALMAPYSKLSPPQQLGAYAGLKVGMDGATDLDGYAANIHRDWAWGEAENEANLRLIDGLAGSLRGKRVLVLGCGSGRLAYDIHQRLGPSMTVGLDHNPMLLTLASRLADGETISLHEFPRAPIGAGDVAVQHELKAPTSARSGLTYVLADAFETVFKAGSFDAVVTHWFVDVVPRSFEDVCATINHQLSVDASWINSGSFAFAENPHPSHRAADAPLTVEEVSKVARAQGFADLDVREDEVDYLASPYSRSRRRERLVSWSCVKRQPPRRPPASSGDVRPAWLVDLSRPVPARSDFAYQAEATKIHAYVMALIDGQRSVDDIAAVFDRQQLMPLDEARAAIAEMLAKMLD